jgi:ribosomal-protein-alanine N-acetyltransferase
MGPAALAAIHALCFDGAPRPWSEAEFADLLASGNVVLVTRDAGFALARLAGPEAELLTIAVAPTARRRGNGRLLLAGIEAECAARGAVEIFLEVAESNRAARRLYAAAGYGQVGFRRDYYTEGGRRRVSALVLRKVLFGRAGDDPGPRHPVHRRARTDTG